MSRGSLISAVVVALAAVSCGGDAPPPKSELFGMNAQHLLVLAKTGDDDALQDHVNQIADLGITFVRANLNWGHVQPAPPTAGRTSFDFSTYDAWVESLATRGLRWQPTLIGLATPTWAASTGALPACGSRAPPEGAKPFASLAGAVAERYGRKGSFWNEQPEIPYEPVVDFEIWNSPNYGYFWCPAPEPERYGKLYAAARDTIKAHDPRALVLVAGLGLFTAADAPDAIRPSLPADEFLERMLAVTPGRIDAIGAHLYGPDSDALLQKLAWFRGVLDETGLEATPIVVTEAGWPTAGLNGPAPLVEQGRAHALSGITTEVAAAAAACGVHQFSAHTWISPELNPADAEHWYGMADPASGDPYPTALEYADAIPTDGQPAQPREECAG